VRFDAESQSEIVSVCGRRCGIRPGPAAARNARIREVHQAQRARGVRARRRVANRASDRHDLQPARTTLCARPRHGCQLHDVTAKDCVSSEPIRLVLFDLDGTLADTAPDLAAIANRLREMRGLAPLPLEELRPVASHGARGLIGRALGIAPGSEEYEELRNQFYAWYDDALCVHTQLFPGMPATLEALEQRRIRWGIVTNKIRRFTDPLVAALG